MRIACLGQEMTQSAENLDRAEPAAPIASRAQGVNRARRRSAPAGIELTLIKWVKAAFWRSEDVSRAPRQRGGLQPPFHFHDTVSSWTIGGGRSRSCC